MSLFEYPVLKVFDRLENGFLEVTLKHGARRSFGDPASPRKAKLHIINNDFFRKVALHGAIGFGESYMDGDFNTPDLTSLLRLFVPENTAGTAPDTPQPLFSQLWNTIKHKTRKNTLKGSRRNIQEHYDLSNDFYSLFLDDSMTYSSALFENKDEDLGQAQKNKIRRMANYLEPEDNKHILEIGCGWGSWALDTVKRTGCKVTGLTLSDNQLAWAKAKTKEAQLDDKINLQLRDYRKTEGQFDRIVSTEMIEAVGPEFLPGFFKHCDRLLKPGGKVALQVITMPDHRYEQYKGKSDWIQKYIFPGGHLPSVQALNQAMQEASSLRLESQFSFGTDYAETLRRWRDRFETNWDSIHELGFSHRFQRMWRYYLCYCEAGFDEHYIDVQQLVLARPS